MRTRAASLHDANVVVDGAIDTAFDAENFPERHALEDRAGILDLDVIGKTYWRLYRQPCKSWTFELGLRPQIERF